MSRRHKWLAQIHVDPEAADDVRKVAAAIAECAPPDEGYFEIGGSNVFADEFLFQLADDVIDLRAVNGAIYWLHDHGYLNICANAATRSGSVLWCALVTRSLP